MTRWYDVARRHPCGVLLVVQLAAIVVYPFLDVVARITALTVSLSARQT